MMCDWRHVAGQGNRSILPTHASDQYTIDLLGGVIFVHTQSQERKITAAPIVPKINDV